MTLWSSLKGWKSKPAKGISLLRRLATFYADHMAKKPRIPDPISIVYCIACHKPTNGRGWFGPSCQCHVELNKAERGAHSIRGGYRTGASGGNGWKAAVRSGRIEGRCFPARSIDIEIQSQRP